MTKAGHTTAHQLAHYTESDHREASTGTHRHRYDRSRLRQRPVHWARQVAHPVECPRPLLTAPLPTSPPMLHKTGDGSPSPEVTQRRPLKQCGTVVRWIPPVPLVAGATTNQAVHLKTDRDGIDGRSLIFNYTTSPVGPKGTLLGGQASLGDADGYVATHSNTLALAQAR